MDLARKSIAERRHDTDMSLGAERARAHRSVDELTARARTSVHDDVEQDRLVVDEQLRQSRDSADFMLARERTASSVSSGLVEEERSQADRATMGERDRHDAILEHERQRSDDALQEQPAQQAADPATRARQEDTDEKLAAERLRVDGAVASLGNTERALSRAEEQVRRRSNVLAMVAHELRNPLSVIAMNTDFMVDGVSDPEFREAATEVQRSVARMARILKDLIDLARIENGSLCIVKSTVDVGALSNEIHMAYGPLFAKRGIAFTCAPPAPGTVAAFDHDRIVQVVSNLVSNSMKFTPAGGTVSLSVERRADVVELAVTDTGAGIVAAAQPHVFTRFWQGNSEPGTGLGLGLYICEKIISAHGGRIWVESELGRGTTFRFTLPISAPAAA